jgi:hypothetical protein
MLPKRKGEAPHSSNNRLLRFVRLLRRASWEPWPGCADTSPSGESLGSPGLNSLSLLNPRRSLPGLPAPPWDGSIVGIMKIRPVYFALCLALPQLISGCGSSSSSGNSGSSLPPVQAAQAYSNAALVGTYSVSLAAPISGPFIGTIVFDGKGNIIGGQMSDSGTNPCTFATSGTYSVNGDASGSLSLTTGQVPGSSQACSIGTGGGSGSSGTALNFQIEAAQGGEIVYLAETDGGFSASGSASKQ